MKKEKTVKRVCGVCGGKVDAKDEPPDYPARPHLSNLFEYQNSCSGNGKPTKPLENGS